MNPLTALPPQVRQVFYWLYATIGVVLGGFQVVGATEILGADLTKTMAVFAYVGTALAVTAGSNVPSYRDVVEGDAAPPDEFGHIGVLEAVLILVAVVVLLAVLGFIPR